MSSEYLDASSSQLLKSGLDVLPPCERGHDGRKIDVFVLIEPRFLHAECLVKSLRLADLECDFETYPDLVAWSAAGDSENTAVLLLSVPCVATDTSTVGNIEADIAYLKERKSSVKFAVLSDQATLPSVLATMQAGSKGYLPTHLPLAVVVRVLHLLASGGTYVPISSISDLDRARSAPPSRPSEAQALFSPRQLMVARALRNGTPNKVIAYQLGMCESTVKVHIRTIMKKLKAKNRTEIALIVDDMLRKTETGSPTNGLERDV